MNLTVKKGQGMSLEMIIGLMILLVVAAVIINIFITKVSPESLKGVPEKKLSKDRFIGKCKKLCDKYRNSGNLEYCTTYFAGKDWNLNDKKNELTEVGTKVSWDTCEDRVYCFLATDCEWSTGELTIDDCRDLLCQAYSEKYNGDMDLATKALKDDIIPSSNYKCKQEMEKLPEYNNWYKTKFVKEGFCGTGGGTTTTTQGTTTTTGGGVSLSCSAVAADSISCSYSNCKGTQPVLVHQNGGTEYDTLTAESGTKEYTGLSTGTHRFVLNCDNGSSLKTVSL